MEGFWRPTPQSLGESAWDDDIVFKTIYCVAHQHDLRLVCLAASVCLIGSATSLRMVAIARVSVRRAQPIWLSFAGTVGGLAMWATHFIAMLAFDPGIAVGYDPIATASSLVVAVVGVSASTLARVELPKPYKGAIRAVFFAATCGAMHYLGMLSLDIPGRMTWRPEYVLGSLLVGWALASVAFHTFQQGRSLGRTALAALALAGSICGLHFVGMMGIVIIADPTHIRGVSTISHSALAVDVSVVTGLIFLAALTTTWIGRRAQDNALALLRSVIDVVPQGLAYFNANGRFMLGNEAYRRDTAAYGITLSPGVTTRAMLEQAMGFRTLPLAGGESDWITRLRAAEKDGSAVRYQHMDDGRFLRIENCLVDDVGAVKVVSDITDLKIHTDELAAARDAAEAAVRAKSAFLANMSHELRTPMNGVIAVAEMLAREELTPRQAELVSIIRGSGDTLDRVLCDLLEVARIDAHAVEIVAAPFNLAEAAGAVVDLHRTIAEEKGLLISVEASAGSVLGDAGRIKQILGNLVSNAIKFTEQGRVEVSVFRQDNSIVFCVSDTGIGFDEAFQGRIFTRFEQADGSSTRRFGGTGLGLSIARDLAQRMGGDLTCESTPGQGSVFRLSLPLAPAATPAAVEPVATLEAGQAQVLVVDDNLTNQRVLSLLLEGAGVGVSLACDGQEALERWRSGSFDAILMDIQMPVMDGLQATAAIRREEANAGRARTPILVVSANALPEHLEASHAAGADGHLSKPVNPAKLFAALAALDGDEDAVAA
jgi:signal transduction histidine kinase/ActR/RegA family two-component response regulator